MKNILLKQFHEPYRLFFPLGIFFLLLGSVIWVPKIWGNLDSYPVFLHRSLMLNGFVASFIGGFLMTAAPRFSQTESSRFFEVVFFMLITLVGLFFAAIDAESIVFFISSMQAFTLLVFMLTRIKSRKANPPFSFIFVIVGLALWLVSGLLCAFFTSDSVFTILHYEGAISAIIIGVGCRLIPAILGHSEIILPQHNFQVPGKLKPLYLVIPPVFTLVMLTFVLSYFLSSPLSEYLRLVIVVFVGIKYWKIFKKPKESSALANCLYICSWMILLSFALTAFWQGGVIHASHKFFISGVVLLCLLIATRVLQAHGPKDKKIENKKILYIITILIVFSGITRVLAFVLSDIYFKHLGYSAFILDLGVIIWSYHFLRYAKTK